MRSSSLYELHIRQMNYTHFVENGECSGKLFLPLYNAVSLLYTHNQKFSI